MGEVSQPGVVGTGTGAAIPIFTSGDGECEDRIVIWKIKNFSEFLELPKEELAKNWLSLEAGNCLLKDGTQTKAIWKFYFQHSKADDVDWVGGHLGLLISSVKSARASFSATLTSEGKRIKFCTTERKLFSSTPGEWQAWEWEKLMQKSELLEKTKGTNELEVSLNVKVFSNYDFKPILQTPPSSSSELVQLRGQMTLDLVKMLDSGLGADVEIKVPLKAGEEVDESSYTKKVHKGMLMTRSTVFETMFAPESQMIEAQTGKVVITDLSPKGLGIFLRYLYTGEVLRDWVQVIPEIINAADKYDCGELKHYCGHNLLPAVTTANAVKMWKLANRHNLSFAAKGIMEFIHKNTKTVITETVIDKGFDVESD